MYSLCRVNGAFSSAMRRATESLGPIHALNNAAAGVIGEHHWERLDGGKYGTTYTGSINTAVLV